MRPSRGYEILRTARFRASRLFSVDRNEYDRGSIWHAVPRGSWSALCGTQPRGREAQEGWSIPEGDFVTCRHCLAILNRHPGLADPPEAVQ
jgi:hypothetical protein